MINDAVFVRDYLNIERSRLHSPDIIKDEVLSRHAQASLFETFLWLHLGVEVGYFTRAFAQQLLAAVYEPELFTSLRVTTETFASDLSEYKVTDIEQRYNKRFNELANLFPSLGPLLTRCVGQQEVFNFFLIEVEDADSIRPVFQALYAITTAMCAEWTIQTFIAAINFCSDREWATLMQKTIGVHELFTVSVPDEVASRRDSRSIILGFIHLLSYMDKFRNFNDDLRSAVSSGELQQRDVQGLCNRIRMMQGWRTTVISPIAGMRITELALMMDTRYRTLLDEWGLPRNYFTDQLQLIKGAWFLRLTTGRYS
jgi:hypothetical protein